MAKLRTPNGDLDIRGLTRKELKKLRKYGYGSTKFAPADDQDMDDVVDSILKVSMSQADFDSLQDLPPKFSNEAWMICIDECYGLSRTEDQEKN